MLNVYIEEPDADKKANLEQTSSRNFLNSRKNSSIRTPSCIFYGHPRGLFPAPEQLDCDTMDRRQGVEILQPNIFLPGHISPVVAIIGNKDLEIL